VSKSALATGLACALVGALLGAPSLARAWEPFRSESRDVLRGNEHLKKGQYAEALEAYETAQQKLPGDPGVQLNRGLALLQQGKLGPAREAFRNATQGNAPADIRGQALYDLGLAFMKEADTAAKGEDLEGAQKSLQEAVDAFKSSLRAKPGNRNAAWNLEIARRRLVENKKKQEEKQKQDEEKKKDEEKKDEDKQDQDGGTPPENDGDGGTPEQPKDDEQKPDEQKQDEQKQDQQKQDGDKGEPKDKPPEGDKGDKGQEPKDKGEGQQKPEPKPQQDAREGEAKQPSETTPEQRMPEHMKKALDALSNGEQNLQKQQAQTRAQQRPRRIEKDW
jgi:Ca-activated chloride channel family protein